MSRLRILILLAALVALATTAAACGSDDDGGSSEDPQEVLDKTFSGDNTIESADVDASMDIDVRGAGGGEVLATLTGPIDGSGEGTPRFDLGLELHSEGGGDSLDFEGGAISTGDAGYVSYKGTDYELDAQTFGFIEQVFESASQEQSGDEPSGLPQIKSFLTGLSNEGTDEVEGVETVHVSGDVDVPKLIDTIGPLARQAQALGGLGGGQIPTPEELDQLSGLIESATFDVYSGTEDDLLRRFDLSLGLQEPGGPGTATIAVDVTLAGVNETQEIEAPNDAKPLSALLSQFGIDDLGALGLGGLGGLGGGTGGGPGGAELDCLQQAQTRQDLEECLR